MLSNEHTPDERTPSSANSARTGPQEGEILKNQTPSTDAGGISTGVSTPIWISTGGNLHETVDVHPGGATTSNTANQDDASGGNHEQIPPIAEVTQALYEKILRRLIKYSSGLRSHDHLEPVSISPEQLVDDLYDRQDIQSSSFSTYRSALLWAFGTRRIESPIYQAGLDRIMERSRAAADGEPPKKGRKQRKKVIPETDFHLLIDELTGLSSRSKWAYRTMYWVHSSLATGLRPIEWENAQWTDDKHAILEVKNAKRKVSPAAFLRKSEVKPLTGIPEERQVPVQQGDRFYIEQHMKLIDEAAADGVALAEYYQQCRRALWRACRKLWGGRKSYSLYTMRGQFSANNRAAVGSGATSVLMGHSREDTPSAASYGKANQAHRGQADRVKNQGEGQLDTPLAPSEQIGMAPQGDGM